MVIGQSERTQFLSVNVIYKRTKNVLFIILQNCLTNLIFNVPSLSNRIKERI